MSERRDGKKEGGGGGMSTLGRESPASKKKISVRLKRVSDLMAQSIRAGPGATHRHNVNSDIGRASEPLF